MRTVLLMCLLVIVASVATGHAQTMMQDVVYLKDGSVVRGIIIEQVPGVSVKIRTADGNIFVYQIENIEKLTKEKPYGAPAGDLRGEKSPGVAWLLSFLVPGVGQHYNGDYTKGVIMHVTYIGGFALAVGAGTRDYRNWYQNWDPYGNPYDQWDRYSENTAWLYVGTSLMLSTWIWSQVDAALSAGTINRQRREYFGHMLEFDFGKHVVGLDLGQVDGGGFSARLALHF